MELKSILSSVILNVLRALIELSGIIGYSKIEIFLINSRETYKIEFNLSLSDFFFQGS